MSGSDKPKLIHKKSILKMHAKLANAILDNK